MHFDWTKQFKANRNHQLWIIFNFWVWLNVGKEMNTRKEILLSPQGIGLDVVRKLYFLVKYTHFMKVVLFVFSLWCSWDGSKASLISWWLRVSAIASHIQVCPRSVAKFFVFLCLSFLCGVGREKVLPTIFTIYLQLLLCVIALQLSSKHRVGYWIPMTVVAKSLDFQWCFPHMILRY